MNHPRRIHYAVALCIIGLCIWTCGSRSFVDTSPFVQAMLEDPTSFFYVDGGTYPVGDTALPVGVFDSGTGGLTVLDAILRFDGFDNNDHSARESGDGIPDFSEESFIYLADQANLPYGNYSREDKTDLLKEHILKDVQFLLSNKYYLSESDTAYRTDKQPVKAIVIACNTATAYGKSDIEWLLKKAGISLKVIGVIGAGVRGALSEFGSDEDGSIGVMATAGTVASMGYVKTLEQMLTQGGYSGRIVAFQQPGIGLAGAIDGFPEFILPDASGPHPDYQGPAPGHPDASIDLKILHRYGFDWTGNAMLWEGEKESPQKLQINSIDNYVAYHVVSLMEKIREASAARPLKTIILGCTHYPYYADLIAERLDMLYHYQEEGVYIYRPYMTSEIALIDPAINTARELYTHLHSASLFNRDGLRTSEFYVSVPNVFNPNCVIDEMGRFPYAYKYGRDAGHVQEYVRRIPFSRTCIPGEVVNRLEEKIPDTYRLIRDFHLENPKVRSLDRELIF